MGMKECYICERIIDEDELHDHFTGEHMDEVVEHMKRTMLVDATSEMSWECPYVEEEDKED